MKFAAALPYAHLLSVTRRKKSKPAARQKSRSRERKTAVKSSTRSLRKAATAPRERTFAELLKAAGGGNRTVAELLDMPRIETFALQHQPPSPPRRVEAPQARSQLTPVARRIIALGAEARGESLASDGIEAQLKRERDKACGIDPVARRIIARAEARA